MQITQVSYNSFMIEFTDDEIELLDVTEHLNPKGAIAFLLNAIKAGLLFLTKHLE